VYDIGMCRTTTTILSLLVLVGIASTSRAERPPQKQEDANLVVVGVIKDLVSKESTFAGDGVRTDFTAEITVGKVERGDGVKAGEAIKATWFRVTKAPSKPIAGAYGHAYPVAKKGETVRAYLMKGAAEYLVIYNSAGIEAIKK
jgi:hypothetical protein